MNSEDRHRLFKNEDYFVENVRNFDQLLDKLVPELLPQEIKDHLLQVDGNPSDQKKELLYIIPKRGPSAFRIFMQCLQATGNEDVANTIQLGNPETGHTVKKANYRRDHDFNTCYRMQSNPRGLALIINILKFRYNAKEKRYGSEKDVRDLEKLWRELGYKVTVLSDLTYTGINREVHRFSKLKEHKDYDSCVVIIMSHGKSGSTNKRGVDILCHDNVYVHSQQLVEMFYAGCCPDLAGKPKLFFFQACRGKMKEYGVDVNMFNLTSNMSNMNVKDSCDCGEISFESAPTACFNDSLDFNRSQSVPTARLDESSEFIRSQSAQFAGFNDTATSGEISLPGSNTPSNLTMYGQGNMTITSNEITRDSNDPCFADISFNSATNGFSDSSHYNGYNDSNRNLMNSPRLDDLNFHVNGNSGLHNNYFRDFDLDDSNTVTDAVINEEGNSPTTPSNTPLASVTPPVTAASVTDINPFTFRLNLASNSNEDIRNFECNGIKFVQGNGTDIFIIYSSQPGYVSLRCRVTGAWVMQEVCNVFAEHAHKDDLNMLLHKVMDNLDKFYRGSSKEIALLHLENLHFKKKLFFNPGL